MNVLGSFFMQEDLSQDIDSKIVPELSVDDLKAMEQRKLSDQVQLEVSSFLQDVRESRAKDTSLYAVLGIPRGSSVETIESAYSSIRAFLTTRSRDIKGGNALLQEVINFQQDSIFAYETLKKIQNPEQFIATSKNMHDLLDRLEILSENDIHLVKTGSTNTEKSNLNQQQASEENMISVDGVITYIKALIAVREKLPQQVITQKYLQPLPEAGNILTIVTQELQQWAKLEKEIRQFEATKDLTKLKQALVELRRLGYKRLSRWNDKEKLEVIRIEPAIERLQDIVNLSPETREKRKIFAGRAVDNFRLTKYVDKVLSAGIEPTSEVPETPVLSVEL